MSRIRGKNTTPEVKVRKELHRRGFRYRINVKKLPGTPDIVLAKYRTVIFVNGCFWHGHDRCQYYSHPKTNPEFWEKKVLRNKERDALVIAKLEAQHWNVLTVWECELKKALFSQTMDKMVAELSGNKEKWAAYREESKIERKEAAAARRLERERQMAFSSSLNISKKILKLSNEEEP